MGGLVDFPGAVHEENETLEAFIDKRASDKQREALLTPPLEDQGFEKSNNSEATISVRKELVMSDAASIARQYFEGWNRRDWDRWRELLHPEYSYTGGDGVRQQGPEAGLAVGQMFASAFPDGRIEIKQIHDTGNVVVAEFIAQGTHQGNLMGIAPTGRRVEMPVCNVIEVKDGKIYAEREYIDMLHMMRQLGLVPEEAEIGAR